MEQHATLWYCDQSSSILQWGIVFVSCSFCGAGIVELVADYTVCTEGQNISPEASRILVLLHVSV